MLEKPPLLPFFLTTGIRNRPSTLTRSILTRSLSSFISLAPSVGNDWLIFSQTIVLLPTKLLSLDGLYTGTTPRSCGDGSIDPSFNSKCIRANEAKWKVEALSPSRGSNTSHHRRSLSRQDEEASSPENSKGKDATEYTMQSMHDNDHMMKSLRRELDEVKNAMKGKTVMNLDGMLKWIDSPFTANVLEFPLPPKFRLLQLEFYDGMKDPLNHIGAFKTILNLQQTPDEVICRSFPATLRGATRVWLSKLPASSIANFEQLSDSFVCCLIGGQRHKRPTSYLL